MPYGKDFLYYIKDHDSGRYYTWNRVDGVQVIPEKTNIEFAPEEWQNTEISWQRSKDYWGIFRNFTTPFNFHLDGVHIMRYIYATQGIRGEADLLIEELQTIDGSYLEMYTGAFDFSKFRSDRDGATISIKEGGLVDLIFNNENTTYEIPIEEVDSDQLLMDGIHLQGNYHYIGTHYEHATADESEIPLPLAGAGVDGEYNIGIQGTVMPNPTLAGLQNYVIFTSLTSQDLQFRLQETITFTNDISSADVGTPTIYLRIFADIDTAATGSPLNVGAELLWQAPSPLSPGDTQTYTIDNIYPYHLNEGNVVVITTFFNLPSPPAGSVSGYINIQDDGQLDISSIFRTPRSYVRAYRFSQIWAKIIDKVTGGLYTGLSPYLTDDTILPEDNFGNVPWSTLVTCGKALSGFDNPVIKTTLADVYKTAFAIWGLGISLDIPNGIAYLKPVSEILNGANEICDLGEVSELVYEPAIDMMGGLINSGYASHDSNTLNGKYEFNTSSQFKLPFNNLKTPLDWKSPWYAGMYDIETVRVNLAQRKTTDFDTDDSVYLIESNINLSTGIVTLQRLQNDPGNFVVGLPDVTAPDAFNLGLTPERCIFRKGDIARSILDLCDDEAIIFQTAERNADLQSQLYVGDLVHENQNININTLIDKIFKPFYMSFKSRIPKNLIDLINDANGEGYITFRWRGQQFRGFPDKIGIYPYNNGAYNVKLLAHPTVDLELIL